MRKNVSIDVIPKHVINALLAIEDIRFYEHNGIDIKRIFGAMINDISSGSLKEGAKDWRPRLWPWK
jgi:penicillin-binding protein 1A